MNKIYKVVWSKVKNCYVVVSEIAKNVISGSVKSAKVGATPVVKGMALGALMAFVITGNAWAGDYYWNGHYYIFSTYKEFAEDTSISSWRTLFPGDNEPGVFHSVNLNGNNLILTGKVNGSVPLNEHALSYHGGIMRLYNANKVEFAGDYNSGIYAYVGNYAKFTDIGDMVQTAGTFSTGYFIYNYGSTVEIDAKNIDVDGGIYSTYCDYTAEGLINGSTDLNVSESITLNGNINAYQQSTIDINANQSNITGDITSKSGSVVSVTANTNNITGGMLAEGENSRINITANSQGNIVGDVNALSGGGVSIDLAGSGSSFTGSSTTDDTNGGVVLDLTQGATWYVTGDSKVDSIVGDDFNIIAANGMKDINLTIECGNHNLDVDDYYDHTNSTLRGVNMFLVAPTEDGLTDGVTINSDSDVSVVSGTEHGISINAGGKVDVDAANVNIDSFKAAIWVEKNGDELNKGEVYVNASGDVYLKSEDRFAINNESQNNGIVDVRGNNVTIISESMPAIKVGETVYSEGYDGIVNISGEKITLKGASHEIVDGWQQRASVLYASGGTINIDAADIITVTDTAKIGGNAVGSYNGGNINIKDATSVVVDGRVYAHGEGSKVDIANVGNVSVTSASGSAINSASNNSTIKIGDAQTVKITGATQNLSPIKNANGETISYNEDNRAVVYAKGTVNITATDKVEIVDKNDQKAISAYGGANVTVDGGNQTLIYGEINADGHEYASLQGGRIEHQDNGIHEKINIAVKGDAIVIDAKGGEAVFARGDSVGGDEAVIKVGDVDTDSVYITNTTNGLAAMYNGSKVEVNGERLDVNATSGDEDAGIGIYAANNDTVYSNPATVDVKTDHTKITVDESGHAGIWARYHGVVNVNNGLEIQAKNAIIASGGAVVNVNESGNGVVKIDGDIEFNNNGTDENPNAGADNIHSGVNAEVNINLNTSDSYLKGNIFTTNGNHEKNLDFINYVEGMNLALSNEATWETDASSFVNSLYVNGGNITVKNAHKGSVVVDEVTGNKVSVKVDELVDETVKFGTVADSVEVTLGVANGGDLGVDVKQGVQDYYDAVVDGTGKTAVDNISIEQFNLKAALDITSDGVVTTIKPGDKFVVESDVVATGDVFAGDGSSIKGNASAIDKLDESLETKADKANTLAGYGITNAYTQEEVNAKIEEATSGLTSNANFTELQNKVQNISNGTTTNKTVVSGDVEVSGNVKAKTFNGIDLSTLATASSVASNTSKITNISRWGTTTNITGDLNVSGDINADDLIVADGISAKYFNGLQIKTSSHGMALGDASAGDFSVAIGYQTDAKLNSISIGEGTIANSSSVSIGDASEADHLSVSIGDGAKSKNVSVAIGYGAQADSYWAVAMGYHSNADGMHSVAIGDCAKAYEDGNIALGLHTESHGAFSVALGSYASVYGDHSLAIGFESVTHTDDTVSFGHKAGDSYGVDKGRVYDKDYYRRLINVADGVDAHDVATVGQLKNAIANKATKSTTLKGYGIEDAYDKVEVDSKISTMEGNVTNAYQAEDAMLENRVTTAYESADEALSIGYETADSALNLRIDEAQESIALKADLADVYTKTIADEKFAVKASTLSGYGIADAYTKEEVETMVASKVSSGKNYDDYSLAVGRNSDAGHASLAVGVCAEAKGEGSIAIGSWAEANVENSLGAIAIGTSSKAEGLTSLAIGSQAQATEKDSIAIGNLVKANYEGAIAIAYGALADAEDAIAFGRFSKAIYENSMAFGVSAEARGINSSAIGSFSSSLHNNSVAIGYGSVTNDDNTVSFGHNAGDKYDYGTDGPLTFGYDLYRRLTHVADGINDHDVVTVGQLNSIVSTKANASDVYTKTEVDTVVSAKADKADTLSDYGITDAYTKAEVDSEIVGMNASVTEAYKSADTELEGRVNTKLGEVENAYQQADAALESKVTNAYQAADAALESKVTNAYKAADVALESKVTNAYQAADTALESKVTEAYKSADEVLRSGYETADNALSGRIDEAKASIALKANIADVYTKTVADAKFAVKASTLAGYGITDAYTQAEVNAKIADATNGLLTDANLTGKADKADTLSGYGIADAYTKDEVNAKIADATSGLLTDANLAGKADKADTLSGYGITDAYTKAEVDSEIVAMNASVTEAYKSADIELEGRINAKLGEVENAYQAADIALESKVTNAYQAADAALESKVTNAYQAADIALESKVTEAYKSADEVLRSGYETADNALSGRINEAQASIALKANIADVYTKTVADAKFAVKASTLAGYGITDAYTQAEVNAKIADATSGLLTDANLTGKADKADTLSGYGIADAYTKDEVNAKIADATSGLLTDANLAGKADKADTLSGYGITDAYTKAEVDSEIVAMNASVTEAYKSADIELEGRINAKLGEVENAYQQADIALESKVTSAYNAADVALESKVTEAYKSADEVLRSSYETADNALSGRIDEAQASIALKANIADVYTKTVADEKFAVKASTLAGYGITDAYTQAEVNAKIADATSGLLTDANLTGKADKADTLSGYGIADAYTKDEVNAKIADATSGLLTDANLAGKADKADTLSGYGITDAYTKAEVDSEIVAMKASVTEEYKSADAALEGRMTDAYKVADVALESKVTEGYKQADAALEGRLNTSISEVEFAYKQADEVILGNITAMGKAYTDADVALERRVTTAYENADKALKSGYEAADNALRDYIDQKISGVVTDANVSDLQNKTQNITAEAGKTIVDGEINTDSLTASGNVIANGSVIGGSVVSTGNVEASGDIITSNGDVKAGDVSLQNTANQVEANKVAIENVKTDLSAELDKKANASDVYTKDEVYTKAEADAIFVKQTAVKTEDEEGNTTITTDTVVKQNVVEVKDVDGNITTTTKTEIDNNFIVEGSDKGAEVSINKDTDSQVIIGADGKMIFGTNSTAMDKHGVYAGRIDETGDHDYANAKAAINDEGEVKAASGKFTVDKDGNVKATSYNGINLEQFVNNSQEAISGLNQRLGQMNGKINKVGAGAAALAALHPLEYDPDDKLTFSAGVGNYAGENAAALGAFYRPDEKLMFSIGGTMGNGENMVNLGVSIGLDGAKGIPKLSRKELVQIVAAMHAESKEIKTENEAIKAENVALEERVAKLEALVAKLAEK